MRYQQITLVVVILFASIIAAWAEEVSLTLDEAIAIALRDNRDILITAKSVEKAKDAVNEALSDLMPTLNISASKERTDGLRDKPYKTVEIHASLKQTLFASGQIINNIRYNKCKEEVELAKLDQTIVNTIMDVKKAFCTLILANDFCNLNKQILDNTKQHLDFLDACYKKGETSDSDILNIKASVEKANKAYQISLNQFESAQTLLKKLLYMEESINITAIGQFAYEPEEISYDKALLAVFAKRPEIRQYEAQEKADMKTLDIAKAGNMPTIYATADYYSGDHFRATTSGANKWANYNVLGITISWPIFDGFATQAKVDEAMADLKKTQLTKEKIIHDVASELKEAYLSLRDSISSIEASESDLLLYKDNLSVVESRYQQGIVSQLDFDDAELKYNISLFNMEQVLYDYVIAKSNFDKAAGSGQSGDRR